MDKNQKLQVIRETGVIAIMRANSSDLLISAAEALQDGGVQVIEVTMTTPGALDVIKEATTRFGEGILFGAGSVLDRETVRAVILAGADFVVAPTVNLEVIKVCNRYGIPVLPGCFTPTEALTAWEAGADMVKLFPAGFGGPALVKAFLAPLPQLEIVPVGGVNLDTAGDFIRAGATALGVGNRLVNQALLDSGDTAEITRRAKAFVAAVSEAESDRQS